MAGPSLIIQPFANGGDLVTIPQTDPNGFVNYQQGYTPFYEISLASGNPQAKPVERQVQNALFNILTGNVQAWQQQGFSPWFAAMPNGYALNAMVVRQNGSGNWIPYRSLTNMNVTDPIGNPASWEYVQGSAEMIKNIPMPAGGTGGPTAMLVTVATDFNTFLASGTYQYSTDAVVSGSPNAPTSVLGTAVAGLLEVSVIGVIPSATIIQRYLDRRGTIFTRSAVYGSAWTAWNVMPNMTQVSAGRYAGYAAYNTNQTLLAAQGGFHIVGYGANLTFTLPAMSTMIAGIPITFTHVGSGTLTILAAGTDLINNGQNGSATSVTMTPGSTLELDAAGTWFISGGTAGMQFVSTPSFMAGATFAGRPTFAGNTPWDSANFNPANYVPKTGGAITGAIQVAGAVQSTTGQFIINGWSGNANAGVIYFGPAANNKYLYFDGTNFNFSAAGGTLTVNGGTVWHTGNLPSPAQTTGASFTGQVDHTSNLRMLNGNAILLYGAANSYYGMLRGDASGLVGFINVAGSAWNFQVLDGGNANCRGTFTAGGNVYAAGGGAFLQTDGNVYGGAWGGYLSTYLANQLAAKAPLRSGGNSGYVATDTGNSTVINWNGGLQAYVDSQYQGNIVTVNGGVNNVANYAASPGATVQWNSGIQEVGPLGNGTIGDSAPWVCVGGRSCGNSSTANCIWLHLAQLRNQ